MSEQSIASARASVMVYDDGNKKWVTSGSSSGLSKVHIYQHLTNNTFRIVGRKLQDHEVVINCSVVKGLKYHQTTATFHQWRDKQQTFGLNFSSRDDAESFAIAMLRALDMMNQNNISVSRPSPHTASAQPVYQTIPGDIETNNVDQPKWLENDNRMNHQNHQYGSSAAVVPPINGPQIVSAGGTPNNVPHRQIPPMNCAPPAPPMPNNSAAPPPPPPPPPPMPVAPLCPPPPPAPPMSMGSNPPCPPPPPGSSMLRPNSGGTPSPMSLASAIANAKLKKTSTNTEGSSDTGKPGPAQANMANMMDEMAKTLARRRAQAECSQNPQDNDASNDKKTWDKQNNSNGNGLYSGNSGMESPKHNRRQRIGSISDVDSLRTNGPEPYEFEQLKNELLLEVKNEISKMKQEIIEAIKIEMNRR